MIQHENIGGLPKCLYAIASGFLNTQDTYLPEVFECTPDEVRELQDVDDLVFQVIVDREHVRFYVVGVGEAERAYQSELIIHNPMHERKASFYFAEVSEAWLEAERSAIAERQIYGQDLEWTEEEGYDLPFNYR
jgi:hypothetical protein